MCKMKIQCNVHIAVMKKADQYLHDMGLNRTTAINMLFHQIANTGQFPFVPSLDRNQQLDDDLDVPYVAVGRNEATPQWIKDLEDKQK